MTEGRGATGQFFAIERSQFHSVCELGIGPITAYLVLAAGTGRDHKSTAWGVHSIEKYTSLSRGRAREALDILRQSKLLKHCGRKVRIGGKLIQRRQLILPPKATRDLIWLPNQLVTGAAQEQSPVDIVRELGDPLALRLLVDLYGEHRLEDWGGIPPEIVFQKWTRKTIGECGPWVVFGFEPENLVARLHPIVQPHVIEKETKLRGRFEKKSDWAPWWDRLKALGNSGLIEWIPFAFGSEAPDAQPIFPVRGSIEPERELAAAIESAALRLLPDFLIDAADGSLLLPVRKHLGNVQVKSLARLVFTFARDFAAICHAVSVGCKEKRHARSSTIK
jgi:hypothetical protein